MAKIKFTVKKVNYRYDLFASVKGTKIICNNARLKKNIRKQMEIRGIFPFSLNEDDTFEAEIEIKMDKRNSTPYLNLLDSPKRIGLETNESLAKFIRTKINDAEKQNDKLQKWKLSLPVSNEIVRILGLDAIQKIIDNPEKLLLYPHLKLNEDKIFEMQNILKRNASIQKIASVLLTSCLKMNTILNLYDTYGEETLNVIHNNPYQICYDGKISFYIADKLAYDNHFNKNDPIRIKTGITEFMKYKQACGNVCILRNQFYEKKEFSHLTLNSYLDRVGVYKYNNITVDEIENTIDNLLEDNRLVMEEDFNSKFIYLPEIHNVENQLVNRIQYLLSTTYNQKFCDQDDIDDFLSYYENKTNINLDILQKKAVEMTLQHKLSILTGGPGTGKTATVSVIVNAIKHITQNKYHREAEIILLAPTGKAAERMTELTNELSSTIHRGIGLKYTTTIPREITADFVIVDESSMIDIFLMNNLLKSLTDNCKVLFVGDVNQLPSVGPGKILFEFINSGKIEYVQLKTIFRQAQGSAIVSNANKIILGLPSTHPNGVVLENNNTNFKFIKETDTSKIQDILMEKIDDYLAKGISLQQIAVLVPMRKGELGVENLNTILQEKYNKSNIFYENKEEGVLFKLGDKIIQTRNNYDLNVFNGYIGTIKEIDNQNVVNGILKPSITVQYENMDTDVIYEGETISELELAYVLTIHKSQGSEYPYVISPFHMEQKILLNRNLLYTDVTRAKKEFCCIGDEKAINRAILTEMSDFERISRISYKIAKNC